MKVHQLLVIKVLLSTCRTAFPMWVVAMVLMYMVVFYGGLFTAMTGGFLVLGNILYASIRNRNPLVIPFEDGHLIFSWGPTFWLCLFTGEINNTKHTKPEKL